MRGKDYNWLSRFAIEAGSPEDLIRNIEEGGAVKGRWQGALIGCACGVALAIAGSWLKTRFEEKRSAAGVGALELSEAIRRAAQASGQMT